MKALSFLLIGLPVLGLLLKTQFPAGADFDRGKAITVAERLLETGGLKQDKSANISISGQKAAVAFVSPEDCPGVVLLAPLPPTAQSFETVVSGFDRNVSSEGFVYRGKRTDTYPRTRIIADRISHAFYFPGTDHNVLSTTVFAYRELGQCGLVSLLDWKI